MAAKTEALTFGRNYLDKNLARPSENIICKIHTFTSFHTQNIAYPVLGIIGTGNDTSLIQLDNLIHKQQNKKRTHHKNCPTM